MNMVMNYESIFERYGGIMRTCELTREGISYQVLQNLIEQGRVEKSSMVIISGRMKRLLQKCSNNGTLPQSYYLRHVSCDVLWLYGSCAMSLAYSCG